MVGNLLTNKGIIGAFKRAICTVEKVTQLQNKTEKSNECRFIELT